MQLQPLMPTIEREQKECFVYRISVKHIYKHPTNPEMYLKKIKKRKSLSNQICCNNQTYLLTPNVNHAHFFNNFKEVEKTVETLLEKLIEEKYKKYEIRVHKFAIVSALLSTTAIN